MRTARNIGFTVVIPLAYADEEAGPGSGTWDMKQESWFHGMTVTGAGRNDEEIGFQFGFPMPSRFTEKQAVISHVGHRARDVADNPYRADAGHDQKRLLHRRCEIPPFVQSRDEVGHRNVDHARCRDAQ